MARRSKEQEILAWGLPVDQESQIRSFCRGKYRLDSLTGEQAPSLPALEQGRTAMVFLSPAANRALRQLPDAEQKSVRSLPMTIVLDKGYSLEDLEEALDADDADVLRPPLSNKALAGRLAKAAGIFAVHDDVLCMTKEILLERELLERKNEILSFLVNFLTNTTQNLQYEDILQSAFSGFKLLFPVRALHAALWEHGERGETTARVFVSTPEDASSAELWRNLLLEKAGAELKAPAGQARLERLILTDQDKSWRRAGPDDGHIITLPLRVAGNTLGVVLLLTDLERSLGRDQALALDSAARHLALTLHNAGLFSQASLHAEYDGLTGLHNRRHFEERLKSEMDKHTRYNTPFCMILADLDHFKQVNDNYGHCAGDEVLRRTAEIIKGSLRASDYCARYGGEEFVILLPQASPESARLTAERLRRSIAAQTFNIGGVALHQTMSLGLAGSVDLTCKDGCELLTLADTALYAAKAAGRNRVRIAGERNEKIAAFG